MQYLLIDGNNLAIRSAFANEELSNQNDIPTGVHYGYFNSLLVLKEKYPSYQFLVVWDGKSKRRIKESEEGIKRNLIKEAYKENRQKDEVPKPLKDFYSQAPYLKRGLEQTGMPQIRLPDFEADDVIASYCTKMVDDEIVVVTSDKDYYQILSDHVKMWDGMKDKMVTEESFQEEFKISPQQHIDCGALMGDTGDNIFGVPSVGEKTSLEAIQTHSSWQNVIKYLEDLYSPVRKDFPDVKGSEFEKLRNIRTPKEEEKFKEGKSWKGKYPEITEDMPYTGVALAFEEKRWKPDAKLKKNLKTNILTLMFVDRIELAYSLKKMDDAIDDLPDIKKGSFNREKLLEYFDYYDIESLKDEIDRLK